MTTTYHEVLPSTKSSKHSGIRWTPAESDYSPVCGTLVIDTDRARVEYLVSEFPCAWRGRGFHLDKLTDGRKAGEGYDCFMSANGPEADSCDCAGATYRPGKACKHMLSLRALLANDWI